jgi:pyoverdine/dityrosine biosynthesis protein Dit1
MQSHPDHADELKIYHQIENILDEVFAYRRELQDHLNCTSKKCASCRAVHQPIIEKWIHENAPIEFILPAFPAKSMNRNKTAGPLPDLGEILSLRFLNNFCKKIQSIYAPGAKLIICSDGRVFNDLVKVDDTHVEMYADAIARIINNENLNNLHLFNLDDFFGEIPFDVMRETLAEMYAEPLADLKYRTKTRNEDRLLFNGIHRFIYEDQKDMFDGFSKNKIKNITKEIAYGVIQRSNAWSRVIKEKFPAAVRLSIHPQPCQSEKIGIMLLKSKNSWATPWHNVPVLNGRECFLMKKNHAEKINAVFVSNTAGEFSHYELSGEFYE